jgi:hypothetical protein
MIGISWCAGLVPALGLARRAGLAELVDRHVTVPGAAGAKVGCLVALGGIINE